MSRKIILIIAALALAGLLTATAVAAYVFRSPATPSGDFTAIPVAAATETRPPEATSTSSDAAETSQPVLLSSDPITAELVQAESQVRFLVDEILNGQSKTVVGVTDQVVAQIILDPTNPANVQMGPVTVNARTLVTDNNFRNRAIQNEILDTDQFEFITFTPKTFLGLPETGAIGETFVFQIVGDLTIRDVTKEITFEVTVTVDSDVRLHGLATAVVSRQQMGLGLIELPPQVASVDDSVTIEIEFVAQAAQ